MNSWERDHILHMEHPLRKVYQEDIVANALIDMALYEQEVERVRLELAGQPDFRINQLYALMDENGSKKLYAGELQRSMKMFDVNAAPQDVMLIIMEYSHNGDFLTPNEFGQMMYPLFNIPTMCAENDNNPNFLNQQVKLLVGKLFKAFLNAELSAEYYRMEIRSKEIDLQAVYRFIDEHRKGILDFEDLKQFLYSKGFYIDREILIGLFRRFDKNVSQQISYQEFVRELTPKLQL